ncbi:zf-TFIIB domain-containing protein [Agromyces sp. NPDC058484]
MATDDGSGDGGLEEVGVPNCPNDLSPMEAVERHGAVFWRCPECGLTRL